VPALGGGGEGGQAAPGAVQLAGALVSALGEAHPPPIPVAFAVAAVALGLSSRAGEGAGAWGRVRWMAGAAGALCLVAALVNTSLFLEFLP